ncbi:hypothetical protein V9K67_07045 [Paraflavisolibacter sp. H34]|uniref:hypothetical protein n=1 Tax=Huijunlia imazamoxiresistens TaxID=3127457 RepID=UPI003019311D
MLALFPDEQIISQVDCGGGTLVLTTQRLCCEAKEGEDPCLHSMMLEEILSFEREGSSNGLLLVLAGAALLSGWAGAAHGNPGVLGPGIFLAVALGAFYYFTRRRYLIITSSITRMRLSVAGLREEKLLHFLKQAGRARKKRLACLERLRQPAQKKPESF